MTAAPSMSDAGGQQWSAAQVGAKRRRNAAGDTQESD